MCLYAGCEASFSTSELLEQHNGVHTFSGTSRLPQNTFAVDIACNDDTAVASKSGTYTPQFHSVAGSSEGHFGASFDYSGLPYSVGDHSVVNDYNNNNGYAPCAVTNTRAQGPPAAGLPNKHIAAPFEWSDHLRVVESPFSDQPHVFGTGPVDLLSPAPADSWNNDIPAAHWHNPDRSRYLEQPFASNAASIGNNTVLTGPTFYNNGQIGAGNPFPIPASNINLVPFDIGPPIPPRPMCRECHQTFGRQSDLERHAKIHEAGSKVFQCHFQDCSYSSSRKDKLGEHVRRRHASARAA